MQFYLISENSLSFALMNFKSLVLIITSLFMLLSPCSMKASIHHILEVEQSQHQSKNQAKTIHSKSTSCSVVKFETIKKSIKQIGDFYTDFEPIKLNFIQFARSSIVDEHSTSVEIGSTKIPFYLLYKQLKYSLLS